MRQSLIAGAPTASLSLRTSSKRFSKSWALSAAELICTTSSPFLTSILRVSLVTVSPITLGHLLNLHIQHGLLQSVFAQKGDQCFADRHCINRLGHPLSLCADKSSGAYGMCGLADQVRCICESLLQKLPPPGLIAKEIVRYGSKHTCWSRYFS